MPVDGCPTVSVADQGTRPAVPGRVVSASVVAGLLPLRVAPFSRKTMA